MKTLYVTATLLITALLLLFNPSFAQDITIVHTNDSHANLLPGGPRNNLLIANEGGLAKLVSYVGLMKQTKNALFFHSGDFSIGDMFYCKYFSVPELQVLQSIGCNGIELGNHEFDLGPGNLTTFLNLAFTSPANALPIFCGNGDFSDTSLTELSKYIKSDTIYSVNGIKIGVFGVVTPATSVISQPDPVKFNTNPTILMTYIGTEVAKLRQTGCQIVILLSHLGYNYDVGVAQNIPGIDLILGGHDHYLKTDSVKNDSGKTYIVQAGAFLKYASNSEIYMKDGKVDFINLSLVHLDSNIADEPQTAALLDQLKAGVESTYGPVYSTMVATATADFKEMADHLFDVGWHDTPVANFAADAFKAWGQTDIGLTANGFTAQPIYKGTIVPADLYRALGYGFNEVNALGFQMVKFEIKGSDIIKGINFGLSNIFDTDDYLINGSGIEYKYYANVDLFNPDGAHWYGWVDQTRVKINGQPIDVNKYYSVTTNYGAAGFLSLLNINVNNFQLIADTTEFMVVTGFAAAHGTLTPYTDGRIQIELKSDITDVQIAPKIITMQPVYPNPCNERVTFDFNVEKEGNYSLTLFNARGERALTLPDEYYDAGRQLRTIDTKILPEGFYLYVITNGEKKIDGRFLVIR